MLNQLRNINHLLSAFSGEKFGDISDITAYLNCLINRGITGQKSLDRYPVTPKYQMLTLKKRRLEQY